MLELNIPGRGLLQLEYLVSDVNGTLAVDGHIIEGLPRLIRNLKDRFEIVLITADTHHKQDQIDSQLDLQSVRIPPGNEGATKAEFVRNLGAERVIAIGQGANDADMLKSAAIGICVLSREGTALDAITSADLLAPDIFSAFELLDNPLRLVASLRK